MTFMEAGRPQGEAGMSQQNGSPPDNCTYCRQPFEIVAVSFRYLGPADRFSCVLHVPLSSWKRTKGLRAKLAAYGAPIVGRAQGICCLPESPASLFAYKYRSSKRGVLHS